MESVSTQKIIKLKNNLNFGTDIRDIIAEFGKPRHKVKRTDFFDYQILFYRFRIGGYKSICEIHLLNTKLFFFTYVFSYLKKKEKKEFKQLLAAKYLSNKEKDITQYKITDMYKNILITEEASDLSVLYMSGDPAVYHQINFVLDKVQRKEAHQNRIQYNELYQFL